MTTIQFYHLLTTPLERALPKLLEKAFAGGFHTLLVAESDERVEQLNQLLWTYDPGSFLPHGAGTDGNASEQPIFISIGFDNPNQATLVAITNGAVPEQPEIFERILDIFDGNNPNAIDSARKRWKDYNNLAVKLSYFKQTAAGGWEQKAVA